jgi:hypothetical protein
MRQQVPREVDSASLMGRALEAAFEGGDEAGVLVGDDEPNPGQAASFERGEEAAPEHLVLAVADVEAEDLAATVGGDPSGHDDRHRNDLGGGVANVQVGRIKVDVGEVGVIEAAGAERGDDLVQASADARHFGLGDA